LDERLHRLLARHGIGSRRQVESWIAEGRVLVNGRPAVIGQRVRASDRVVVDGRDVTKRLAVEQALRVIVYHKPSGEMSKRPAGDERSGVDSRLPGLRSGRWLAVNALGYGEDGLLILTSDGSLASAIARRAAEVPVEFRVRALRPRETDEWPPMPREVDLDGQPVVFSAVERLEGGPTNAWFKVTADRTVPRGAVRSLFDAAGLKVSRVMLVRWGPVSLPRDLPRGRSRDLAGAELDAMLEMGGRARPYAAAGRSGPRRETGSRSTSATRSKPRRGPRSR
jgi:23S rRNA pseudouridine2605 synthase